MPFEKLLKAYCYASLSENLNGLFSFHCLLWFLSALQVFLTCIFPRKHQWIREVWSQSGKSTSLKWCSEVARLFAVYKMHTVFAYCVKVKDWLFCQDWRQSFWSDISFSTFLVSPNHHNDFLILSLTYGCLNDSLPLAILHQEGMWIKDLHWATEKIKWKFKLSL